MKAQPTFDVKNANQLNKFLCGVLKDLRTKKIDVDSATAISKVADKINKNNVNQILYKKITGHESPIDFLEVEPNMIPIKSYIVEEE